MNRREFIELVALYSSGVLFSPYYSEAKEWSGELLKKVIPSSKEAIPIIGMGTWITFNVGKSQKLRNQRAEVLKAFFDAGGGMIDSSPMYGSSEEVLGFCLKRLSYPTSLFAATKVWTSSKSEGVSQISESQKKWGLKKFDLFQVHNLQGWRDHLVTLNSMKDKGELKYVGVTTSHGRRHDLLKKILREQPLDFVQLTYNIVDRDVEKEILPLAKDRGVAVIANRPFQGGELIKKLKSQKLPDWAIDSDCDTWSKFLLKFIVSHPAITCAIPATSQVSHMHENMQASRGLLPGSKMREKMIKYVEEI